VDLYSTVVTGKRILSLFLRGTILKEKQIGLEATQLSAGIRFSEGAVIVNGVLVESEVQKTLALSSKGRE
tara:strand:+ start:371 stop:580 length:210 start_codon:yes stop_codon:yes gene_type:complete